MHSRVSEPLNAAETTTSLSTLDLVVRQYDAQPMRAESSSPPPILTPPNTVIGRLVGFDASGLPLVTLADGDSNPPLPARSTLRLHPTQINSEVVLTFAGTDREQPIIMGCLISAAMLATEQNSSAQVELNGQRLELTAQDEIVLRCGKSSITLTQAGKIIIRGEYLLSRSSGVNRIKGGSVQIN